MPSLRFARGALAALSLTLGACSMLEPPADLDQRLTRLTQQGRYLVTMHPPAVAPALNQLHSWEIEVATTAGAPVTNAQIAFDGGMPQHGHGLPTRPRVTQELAAGRYRLDGMKFSMRGWWEMKVAVRAEQGEDKVVFNTVVPAGAGTQ
jgi:hypothetical protein